MRQTDWARTSLGLSRNLVTTLQMMITYLLVNRFPLVLWWDPEFCQLYNDPFRPVFGTKQPQYPGQPVNACWPEIWHIIGLPIETPFNGGLHMSRRSHQTT
jgi:hypothetical protein